MIDDNITRFVIPKGKAILDCPPEVVDAFKSDFQDPTLSIYDLTQKWQRPSGTIYRYGTTDLGLHRPKLKVDNRTTYRDLLASISKMCSSIERVNLVYPKVSTIATPASMALEFSDLHGGRKTATFNSNVLVERLARLGVEVDKFAREMSSDYAINELVILALGDWALGERLGYQVNVEEVERFIYEQIFELIVPYTSEWLLDRLKTFPTIRFFGVRGNHGELGRFQSTSANWDSFIYKVIEQRLINQERIKFDIAIREFYKLAKIQDASFLCVHGEQFATKQGSPETSVTSKVLRWRASMPFTFTHVAYGHVHSRRVYQVGDIMCYGNGTFLSDDEWVREELGLAGSCSQTALVVSGKNVIREAEVQLK